MIDAQLIFPVKVYRSKFEDSQELQKDIVPLLLEKEKKDTSPVRYSANGYTSYGANTNILDCLLYTSPSPRDGLLSRMPSSA